MELGMEMELEMELGMGMEMEMEMETQLKRPLYLLADNCLNRMLALIPATSSDICALILMHFAHCSTLATISARDSGERVFRRRFGLETADWPASATKSSPIRIEFEPSQPVEGLGRCSNLYRVTVCGMSAGSLGCSG